jgi:hypothetical protein
MSAAAQLASRLQGLTRTETLAVSARTGVPGKIGARARAGRKVSATAFLLLCKAVGLDVARGVAVSPVPRAGYEIAWWIFGAGLFHTRGLRRIDLRTAADIVGVSAATLSRAERGQPMSVESFLRISAFIGIPPESFLSFTGNTNCNTLKSKECAAAPWGNSF